MKPTTEQRLQKLEADQAKLFAAVLRLAADIKRVAAASEALAAQAGSVPIGRPLN